ncbi:MAG: outer membrane beta-barrel domain-containing protein [Pseudobdellovibrio sp.]
MKYKISSIIICCFALNAFAQQDSTSAEDKDINIVEGLLERDIKYDFKYKPIKKSTLKTPQKADYVGVQTEASYADFAVIQKNYMPKSERFQISLGGMVLPTDVYYRSFGLNLKLGYHLSETWGVEVFDYYITSSARSEVNDLEAKQATSVQSLVSLKGYYGANLYYSSIYGKTSVFNSKIIPFEIYQSVGVGKVVNQKNEESTAFQFGLGEIFSLTRSTALRTDLTWAFYSTTNILGSTQASNSLFLTVSYSIFFPEPIYR